MKYLLSVIISLILSGSIYSQTDMSQIAESYVKLVFQVGKYDADYVDAYFGPASLKKDAEAVNMSLQQIQEQADSLLVALQSVCVQDADEFQKFRHKNLTRLMKSLKARVALLSGAKWNYNDETQALYGVVAPSYSEEYYQKVLDKLATLLPGDAPLAQKWQAYREQFLIPPDKVDVVFQAIIEESRKRTKSYIGLPEKESFSVEYVKGKTWGAYNWFQGNGRSLIQLNRDLPAYVDWLFELACHEGYPGHHIHFLLLEKNLYQERKCVEFSVSPLFSPSAVIAEGIATLAIDMAFPGEDKALFAKNVIFPLAGLNPEKAMGYYQVLELVQQLRHASNDMARQYLDGKLSREDAVAWLMKYQLRSKDGAERYVRFVEQYRTYIATYPVGESLVAEYLDKEDGTDRNKRWQAFYRLLLTGL